LIKKLDLKWLQHTDLHETTNSDYTEFRPALTARDGKMLDNTGPVPINVNLRDAPGGAKAEEMFEKCDSEKTGKVTHAQFVACLQEEGVDLKQCLPDFNKGEEDLDKDQFMRAIVEKLLIYFQKSENGKNNNDEIPDGFYIIGDIENPQQEWSKAIIDKVRTVTHICASDSNGNIGGVPMT
jgi:hypothetical protein